MPGRVIGWLLLGGVGAACGQEPDLHRASTAELVELIAKHSGGPGFQLPAKSAELMQIITKDSESPRYRAERELQKRPRIPATNDLVELLSDSRPSIRATAARWLGDFVSQDRGMPGEQRDRITSKLLDRLGDPEERVRLAILNGLSFEWMKAPPAAISHRVLTALRGLLRSGNPRSQTMGALFTFWIGPAAHRLGPDLLAAAKSDDPTVRFAVATALGTAPPVTNEVVDALLAMLDDPVAKVRYSAAASLGQKRLRNIRTWTRLFAALQNEEEDPDVRQEAAISLSELDARRAKSEQLIEELLRTRGVFPPYELPRWVNAVARVAVRIPGAAAKRARKALLDLDEPAASYALARLACAERDLELATRVAPELRAGLKELGETVEITYLDETTRGLGEAAVDMALWNETGIDRQQVAEILAALTRLEDWPIREWATEQLARLR